MCEDIVFLWKKSDKSEDRQESLIIASNIIFLSLANRFDQFVEDSRIRIIEKFISDFEGINKKQMKSFKKNLFWVIYNKENTRFWKKDSSFLVSFSKKEHVNLNKNIKIKRKMEHATCTKTENIMDSLLYGFSSIGYFSRSKN
jgi:hypothetical protein